MAVHERDAPIGFLVGLRHANLGGGNLLLLGEHRHLRVVSEICIECGRVEADRVDGRLARQGCLCVAANPPRQSDLGRAQLSSDLAGAIIEKDQCTTGGQDIGEIAASSPIGTFCGIDFDLSLTLLLRYHRLHGFRVIPIKPR